MRYDFMVSSCGGISVWNFLSCSKEQEVARYAANSHSSGYPVNDDRVGSQRLVRLSLFWTQAQSDER